MTYPYLIWTDIETTGLDPDIDKILEVAMIAGDGDGLIDPDTIKPLHVLINWPEGINLADLTPDVISMHSRSGLFADVYKTGVIPMEAKRKIESWLQLTRRIAENRDGVSYDQKFLMAGSSIAFDRKFLTKFLGSSVDDFFHYRMIDVSSFKEMIKRWLGEDHIPLGESGHRALGDAQASAAELQHYRSKFRQGQLIFGDAE